MENTDTNEKYKGCLDLEDNSMCCFFKVANSFLLLANLLLIILGFHYHPTCLSEDSSYFSVIVAVLGILVTVLITWQIWQTIISRREVEKATKAIDKLKNLDNELRTQRSLLENRNLEIIHLIDAHARLHEAENESDLSYKYILYAEAIMLLIQSNIDMSYEQFENARVGLLNTLNAFQALTDIDEIEDFLNSERDYEKYYQILMTLLTKRSEGTDKLRRQLTSQREIRSEVIAAVRDSKVGKRIKRRADKCKKEMQELEKRLREKKVAHEATQAAVGKKN